MPASAQTMPKIEKTAGGRQLVVDGEPYLFIGGELHNSSASSPEYMKPVWDKLAAMNVRSVIGTASWSDVEPREGHFDFTTVDAQIAAARARKIHIALIWFGAYKNATSTYAPSWVRGDAARFPRAVTKSAYKTAFTYVGAMPKPVLSVFSPELLKADRRAFVALMQHLGEVDPEHTVVMIQIENEIGLLRDSRDRSALANVAWSKPVPAALISYMVREKDRLRPELAAMWGRHGQRRSGTWSEVFGTEWEADEAFMAWSFASYVEELAKAGKAVNPLPFYANAWLGPQKGQEQAGLYPSGGPVARMIDVWHAAAPSLDMLSPDVYVPDVKDAFAQYHRQDKPLFVPEAQFRTGSLFWALGHHKAIGFSVFGVEDGRVDGQYPQALALINTMVPVIAAAQAQNRIGAVLLEDGEVSAQMDLGGYNVVARGSQALFSSMLLDAGLQAPPPPPPLPSETEEGGLPAPGDARPFALVIAEGDDRFLVVGKGVTFDFEKGKDIVELDHVQEGTFDAAGKWVPGRAINGDERLAILPADRIGIARIRLVHRR
ncbi:glycoside hydrolase (plasmid) [Novosphingobium sp. P6W]|nr:glycoside hydrolase [Novosphingobium sp. P6W]KIS29490.1 glycoside hydrolase [Novosphingobium sp. P6W]